MVETLMALWNRGTGGRLLVMVVTFFCLCISISLLFVTVGSIWGTLLTHGRPGSNPAHVSNGVLITATAPPAGATATVEVTPTLPPNPCLASPTGVRGNTSRVDATANHRWSNPSRTATSGPLHGTPTPGATVQPLPSPTVSPTSPAMTPTVTTQPTATPTATNTPGNTPTVAVTPADTSTPGATPTPTPTVPGSTPTATDTPTATVTIPTATVTVPTGSPTVTVSPTGGINGRQGNDGRPQIPGTPTGTNNGQQGQGNCLGDTLLTGGEEALFSRLRDFFWMILLSSLLGTALFCAQMYRLARRVRR